MLCTVFTASVTVESMHLNNTVHDRDVSPTSPLGDTMHNVSSRLMLLPTAFPSVDLV